MFFTTQAVRFATILPLVMSGGTPTHHGGEGGERKIRSLRQPDGRKSLHNKERRLPPQDWDGQPRPCGPDMGSSCFRYCSNTAQTASPCNSLAGPVDIVIIGSGAAGLGALREIKRFNDKYPSKAKSALILEGDNIVGGRGFSANWLAGGELNPLVDIIHNNFGNFDDVFRYHQQFWGDVLYVDGISNEGVKNRVIRDFRSAYSCVSDLGDSTDFVTEPDPGLISAFVDTCLWERSNLDTSDPEDKFRYLLEWFNVEYEFLWGQFRNFPEDDNDFISLWNVPDEVYTIDYQRKDVLLAESGRAAEVLASEFVRNGLCELICLDTKVDEINWANSPIELKTSNGDTISASQVISTLPVGALKTQVPTGLFSPAITDKINAMNKVYNVGRYYEIEYKFPDEFWAKFHSEKLDHYQFIAVAPTGNQEREVQCNWVQVMDTKWNDEFFPGSQVLKCTLTTADLGTINPENWLIDPVPATEFLNHAVLPKLRNAGWEGQNFISCEKCVPGSQTSCNIYETDAPPQRNCKFSVFSQLDELRGGSYATWKRMEGGPTFGDFETYAAPLSVGSSHVFISGSATCPRHYEFVQGGLFSGIRDAKKALVAFQDVQCDQLPETPYLCQSFKNDVDTIETSYTGKGSDPQLCDLF